LPASGNRQGARSISGSETEAVSALGRCTWYTAYSELQCLSNFSTCKEHRLPACDAVYTDRCLPTFRKINCLRLQEGTLTDNTASDHRK
jgi:hypothetical protein